MEQLSQSQYRIIQDFQNRLSQCNNKQKQIQIREPSHDNYTDDGVSNGCTPEKVLKPIMLKSNLKQMTAQQQSSDNKLQNINEQEGFRSKSFTEHLQNNQLVSQNQQLLNPQQTLQYRQKQYYLSNHQNQYEQIQQNINMRINQNQILNNNSYNQYSFQQKQEYTSDQKKQEDVDNEEEDQCQEQNEIVGGNDINDQNDCELEQEYDNIGCDNNINGINDDNNDYNQVLSSERKQNLYVVWQLNQKRNRQYSLQEDQLQKAIDQQRSHTKTSQGESGSKVNIQQYEDEEDLQKQKQMQYQQYLSNQLSQKDRLNNKQSSHQISREVDNNVIQDIETQQQKQQYFLSQKQNLDKENYTPNVNLQAAREQLMREYNFEYSQEKQQPQKEIIYSQQQQQSLFPSKNSTLKSTSQFGNQNIPSNRKGRAFSVDTISQNKINLQNQSQLNNPQNNKLTRDSHHHVSFGQSLNVESIIKGEIPVNHRQTLAEKNNSQKSRLQVVSIKEIEKLITQQDNVSEYNTLPQSDTATKQSPVTKRSSSSQQQKKSSNPNTQRQTQNKQLPPKSLNTKNCKKTKVDKLIKDIKNNGISQKMLLDIIQEHMMECDSFMMNFEQKLKKKHFI